MIKDLHSWWLQITEDNNRGLSLMITFNDYKGKQMMITDYCRWLQMMITYVNIWKLQIITDTDYIWIKMIANND